ncbi:hypothetical protein [Dactylosporangium matsuzakiense]|uniref:LPXTG-motif cell wall-anchored protein n=1 Tax=Dactylosporangium matsuzakiense TaxID=53360 RepID=A0A9W6KB77_9ACTN|nr:hypothetical protein [Dactylosporangium matsuzakiense]UWZ45146.1 hypothetical protein Dmats_00850 [Dactylosporangium matsuzakiense]GLK98905.1 hypothetical protein GCM10017581_006460 [Dactylosporangium matsuzakiense]
MSSAGRLTLTFIPCILPPSYQACYWLDNFGGTDYDIQNALDLAAVGAQASGAAGSTVKVKVGAKNNGPASGNTNRSGGEPLLHLEVRLPEGTELAAKPDNCSVDSENAAKVQCYSPDTLYNGESFLVELALKITKVTPNAAGLVSFGHSDRDPNHANDTADIVINPANGTGGGNPGGDNGNGGGSLPVTGVQVGLVAGAGAALLSGGIFFFAVARRRRVLLVTPKE